MGARLFSPRSAPELSSPSQLSPLSAPPEVPHHGRWREAASLLLFAGALFIGLSLVSFRFDPDNANVHGADWGGAAGSLVARILVQGFGVVAWLAPIELALIGRPLIRGLLPENLGLRVAGDLVVAIVLSALCQVALPEALVFGHAPFAGNVGLLFGEMMREAFSTAGSFLVGPTIVGLILIGRSSFSFIEWARRVARFLERLSARLAAAWQRLGGAWVTARALRKQEKLAQPEPRIVPTDPDAAIMIQLEDDDADWIPMEETAAPPLALSEALRKAAASRSLALSETPTTRSTTNVEESASDVVALSTTPPPESAEKRKRNRGRRAKDAELAAEASDASAEETEANPEETEPEASLEAEVPAPAKKSRKARSNEPEIVDTQHERAVERPSETVVVRVRDDFRLPSCDLLEPVPQVTNAVSEELLKENGQLLMKTLLDYGVQANVQAILPGPTVTMYEVSCEAGTKVSKVAALADDLALGLSRKVRIIAPIPGKNRIGFELPNEERIPVSLRELVEDQRFDRLAEKAPLPVVLGRDIVGKPFYADLASMPHVIVAGATGAGKSVGLNVMLSSLLFKRTPQELRMLMIDPKVVELAPFDGIPHMLLPVVTDMKQAATALRWAVDEMERRYQLFANAGTKNISTYNHWVKRVLSGELPPPKADVVQAVTHDGAVVDVAADKNGADGVALPAKLPFIVVVVDEFADLMMQQGKDVEASVARLAQKARAAGMHVVLATQRPSVDVITGMIKANFPTRIAFRVAQKVDSRTILDEQGAEHLLGRGDMLVKLNGSTETYRVQCPFVSEDEVARLTDYLRAQGAPEYNDAILRVPEDDTEDPSDQEPLDPRFDEAARIVAETQRCSTSWLQRKMTIGYNRAAKIVEMMEKQGMVGPPNGARDRQVFLPPPS
ncbi:MAG: DNA translocase FtsK 4TM domain-containing protein [Myxococcota bacterium]